MQADIIHFDEFYRSKFGQVITKDIQFALAQNTHHERNISLCVGVGYSLPYLQNFFPYAQSRIACMPAQMGALQNSELPQVLCIPTLLPLRDNSVGALLMVHLLEFSENPRQILREAWRVLEDDAQLILLVPHRRGLWARSSEQPFGLGTPYTRTSLKNLLLSNNFEINELSTVLNFPPFQHPSLQKMRKIFAWMTKILGLPAGVILIQARKSRLRPTMVGKTLAVPGLGKFVPSSVGVKAVQSRQVCHSSSRGYV